MLRWWGAGCLAAAALLAPPARASSVVVNAGVVQQDIARPFLRGMFGMRLRAWPDGTPVTVFVLADDSSAHVEFCTDLLQMFPYRLRQDWDRLVYSGTGQPPVVVASQDELLRRVAATPGGIGYVGAVSGELPEQVRILDVR